MLVHTAINKEKIFSDGQILHAVNAVMFIQTKAIYVVYEEVRKCRIG